MLNKIIDFIKLIEPLILVLIPLCFGIYYKLKLKLVEEKAKVKKKVTAKQKQEFTDWRHEESIKIVNRLKEICNYYHDINHVNASFIQLENGTIATSKLCNMFFSCNAEDDRYSSLPKLSENIQRVPFIRMSKWFNKIYEAQKEDVVFIKKEDLDDINEVLKIEFMVSGAVRDAKSLIIGFCSFTYDAEETDPDSLVEIRSHMLKFISAVETVFLNYNLSLEQKKEELGLTDEEM